MPCTPPIFSRSSRLLGSTSIASRLGFSRNGVGSVVSFSGSRWAVCGFFASSFAFAASSLRSLRDFFPLPERDSSAAVSAVVATLRLLPRLFATSSPTAVDHVPVLHIRRYEGCSSPSPITWRVSIPDCAVGLLFRSASDVGGAGERGETGVGSSSEKWTEDEAVSVGEGGVIPDDQDGVGEGADPDPLGRRW
jgi:hypothetical protein